MTCVMTERRGGDTRMHDDPAVVALVLAARDGDSQAWHQIVERYAPLVWGICRRYALGRADADDVGQTVWLSLFQHLAAIREPAALPGWLARTTRNECLRVLRSTGQRERVERTVPAESGVDGGFDDVDEELEREAQHRALREAFRQLRPECQQLLSRLFRDVPPPYLEIGNELGMKIGSIGPTRQRCLTELRRCPALAAFNESGAGAGRG
jgi:RNA polymerase sigma factor (sigma-70 family)